MFIAVLCQEMSWTYQQYMSQPIWFIELLRNKMVIDNKAHEMALKKMKR